MASFQISLNVLICKLICSLSLVPCLDWKQRFRDVISLLFRCLTAWPLLVVLSLPLCAKCREEMNRHCQTESLPESISSHKCPLTLGRIACFRAGVSNIWSLEPIHLAGGVLGRPWRLGWLVDAWLVGAWSDTQYGPGAQLGTAVDGGVGGCHHSPAFPTAAWLTIPPLPLVLPLDKPLLLLLALSSLPGLDVAHEGSCSPDIAERAGWVWHPCFRGIWKNHWSG